MTVLNEIIAGATDDTVATSNLLRKVKVVAHRLKAEAIVEWVDQELNGYSDHQSLPKYRSKLVTPVLGRWSGPGGYVNENVVGTYGVPEGAVEALFSANLTQSLAALESWSTAPQDPVISWDPAAVGYYNQWIDEGKVPHIPMVYLTAAHQTITRPAILGVVEAVRNTALDFALELETVNPESGTPSGPTVAAPAVAQVVNNFTYNTYGDGTNIAQGNNNQQTITVHKGDVDSLLQAVAALNLGEDVMTALQEAANTNEEERPSRLRAIVQRVKTGTLALAGGVTADMAASQLEQAINGFLS